jgi:hypothetical protein
MRARYQPKPRRVAQPPAPAKVKERSPAKVKLASASQSARAIRDQAVEQVRSGAKVRDVAREFGLSVWALYKYLSRRGIKLRKKKGDES